MTFFLYSSGLLSETEGVPSRRVRGNEGTYETTFFFVRQGFLEAEGAIGQPCSQAPDTLAAPLNQQWLISIADQHRNAVDAGTFMSVIRTEILQIMPLKRIIIYDFCNQMQETHNTCLIFVYETIPNLNWSAQKCTIKHNYTVPDIRIVSIMIKYLY